MSQQSAVQRVTSRLDFNNGATAELLRQTCQICRQPAVSQRDLTSARNLLFRRCA